MKNNKKKQPFSWILILIISMFTISIITTSFFIMFSEHKMQRRVMFFYDDIAYRIVADEVALSKRSLLNGDVEAMVSFMISPPRKIEWRPFFANMGQVTMVSIISNICYINLEGDIAKALLHGADFSADVLLIEKSVRFNFPSIEKVVVSYNGLEAFI